MAPLEPWEKVLVNLEAFSQTAHGEKTCIECHGGDNSGTKADAHTGMNPSPSKDPKAACGECHQEESHTYETALHNTQAGYWTRIDERSVPENHAALEPMFQNHCSTCHTTCGECHVNQPDNVGGGLFNGHVFEKTPPMTRSCTACHGSRVGNEYLGKNEGFPGDVHFRQERMNCVKCHSGADLHGSEQPVSHRYEGAESPSCLSCHPDTAADKSQNAMHQQHSGNLSCQVCHSVTYTSCDGCHVAVSEKTGKPFFETQATYGTFKIGRNPLVSAERPYQYTLVRHIPVSATSYQYYGENLLPNYQKVPTWQAATPHNIQLNTPQNASCQACHDNPSLFLLEADLKPEEAIANQNVILAGPILPAKDAQSLKQNAMPMPADHADLACQNCCKTCHNEGLRGAIIFPQSHLNINESSCKGCHSLPVAP